MRAILMVLAVCLAALGGIGKAVAQQPREASAGPERDLALSIYSGGFGLVRAVHDVALNRGGQTIVFGAIAPTVLAETVTLKALGEAAGFAITEQTFDARVITQAALLKAHIGLRIQVARFNPQTGKEELRPAKIIATVPDVVLAMGDAIHVGIPGRAVFPSLPPDLRAAPALLAGVTSAAVGRQAVDLTYLATGLDWKAGYVADWNADGDQASLAAWATVDNKTGRDFKAARLTLMAGDVNMKTRQSGQTPRLGARALGAAAKSAAVPDIEGQRTGGARAFVIEQPVTLENATAKQVALFARDKVSARAERHFDGDGYWFRSPQGEARVEHARLVLVFNNQKGGALGRALPAGVVRVYASDATGQRRFVGEDRIGETPAGRDARVSLGDDFDVTATRSQTEFTALGQRSSEASHRVDLQNASDRLVSVIVGQAFSGEWEILSESQPHEKVSSGAVRWTVLLPAAGKMSLQFKVRTRL